MMSQITRISVDSSRMRNGATNMIRVERDGNLAYAAEAHVGGGAFVSSSIPRPYGATVWFETTEPVILCVDPEPCDESEVAA